jgi:hypothetical protein
MKKYILAIIFSSMLIGLFAFTAISYEAKKSTAEVESIEGLLVFVDSKPVLEYDYLGSVKVSFTLGDTQYQGVRDKFLKKCKKDFPQADGIIIRFKSGGTDVADAIKFK